MPKNNGLWHWPTENLSICLVRQSTNDFSVAVSACCHIMPVYLLSERVLSNRGVGYESADVKTDFRQDEDNHFLPKSITSDYGVSHTCSRIRSVISRHPSTPNFAA